NLGGWPLAPAATEIERETVRWIAELIGYPADTGGLLVSGGNMANMACFWAARAAQAPWNVREQGAAPVGGGALRVYAAAEADTGVQKAVGLGGLGTEALRWIPVDGALRMDMKALAARIDADRAAGDHPMMVVGTAGSVSTGVIDPLEAIAALCRER